jgi:tyrosine-protein kinase Etk/Wzc
LSETTQTQPEGGRSLDLLDVLLIFAHRKWIILAWVVAGLITALVVYSMTPRLYLANATILAPEQEQGSSAILGQLGALSALSGGLGGRTPAELYISLLQTNVVLLDMVDRFQLMKAYNIPDREAAAGTLRKRSKFGASKDGLIQISVEDQDPKRAATLSSGFAEELFQQNNRLAITSASQRRLFFQQQLLDEKNRLADAEVALKQTQQSTGVLQLTGQAENIIRQEAELAADITSHEVQLSSMQTSSTEQNPQMVRLRTELAGLRTQLTQLQKGKGGSTLSQAEFPAVGLEYIRKQREVQYHQTLYDLLARQLEAARIDEAKASPSIQMVDPPLIPRVPSWPRKGLFLIIGLAVGFTLGCIRCAVVWLYEYADTDPRLRDRYAAVKRSFGLRS